MSYEFYLDGTLLPVTPGSLEIKVNGQNETVNLINKSEVNRLFPPGLSEVSFTALLPAQDYPFCAGKPRSIQSYLSKLEALKTEKKYFQFVVVRTKPDGTPMYNTNLTVSLEEHTITEDAEDLGFDTSVEISLKQWRGYGSKSIELSESDTGQTVAEVKEERPAQNAPAPTTYTVKSGDCLWNIAKKQLGDGSRWQEIYNLNKDKIKNPNLIYPNQVLTMP